MSAIEMQDDSPEGWLNAQVGTVFQFSGGGTPNRAEPRFWGGNIPWLSSGDIKSNQISEGSEFITQEGLASRSARLSPAGAIIVVVRSGILKHTLPVAVLDQPAAINQDIRCLDSGNAELNEWLALALRAFSQQILEQNREGTTVQSVKTETLRGFQLPVPPLAEQKRIVAKVETLLARVNAARQRLAKVSSLLKRFRQSVLAAACSGQLTQDWRDAQEGLESATNLLDRLTKLRVQQVEGRSRKRTTNHPEDETSANADIELFEIPDEWCWVKIRRIMDDREAFCYGVVQPGADNDDGVSLIRAGDLEHGTVNPTELRRIPVAVDMEYKRSKVSGGELLVTVVGAGIGAAAIVPDCCKGHNIARAVAKIPVRDFASKYVLAWLQSSVANQWMKNASREVARPTLNLEQLETLPVPLPPLAEQHEIVRRVEALLARADRIEKRLAAATRRVETLTQAILAQAFRGELVPTEAGLARREGREYEPASALLERIRTAPATEKPARKGAPRSRKKS